MADARPRTAADLTAPGGAALVGCVISKDIVHTVVKRGYALALAPASASAP